MIEYLISYCLLALSPHMVGIFGQEMTCLSENEFSIVPKTIHFDLYHGQQVFTISMLSAVQRAAPNENIFFSPYSTYHALLLAYFGARNHTEQELVKVLNLEWAKDKNHVSRAYRVEKQQRYKRSKEMPLEFSSADKIYFSKDIKLKDCLFDLFYEEMEVMDFHKNPEQCRLKINEWIANTTRNEILELLKTGEVSAETQLMLANAAYFKGQWANQFDSQDTARNVFYTRPDKQSFVQMMHNRGTYNLAIDEHLGAHILYLPYQTTKEDGGNSDISMIIVLPTFEKDSIENVISKLSPDTFDQALKESMMREIDIFLPKFKFTQSLELIPIFRKMGLNSIFDADADMSGFSTETKIVFGDAKHVAKIEVDEKGSTAAAATVLFSFRSARPVEPTKFECNHPFLFVIYDHKARALLFTGIFRDPLTKN